MIKKFFVLIAVLSSLMIISDNTFAKVRPPKATRTVQLSATLNSETPTISIASVNALGVPLAGAGANSTAVSYEDLYALAGFVAFGDIYDTLGKTHSLMFAFFKIDAQQWNVRVYANSEDFGEQLPGYPRQITTIAGTAVTGTFTLNFQTNGDAQKSPRPNLSLVAPWSNGSYAAKSISVNFQHMRQESTTSMLQSFKQDGHHAHLRQLTLVQRQPKKAKVTSNIDLSVVLDSDSLTTSIVALNSLVVPIAGYGSNITNVSFDNINMLSSFLTAGQIYDARGQAHTITFAFFKTNVNQWIVRLYGTSEDFGESVNGYPRQLTTANGTTVSGTVTINFDVDGKPAGFGKGPHIVFVPPWVNGANSTISISVSFQSMRQYSIESTLLKFKQYSQRKNHGNSSQKE